MYIVSYISKSQKGMSALLDQATKEARQGNLDLKKLFSNTDVCFNKKVLFSGGDILINTTCRIALARGICKVK
jgi:hypothetical protein